MKTLQTPANPVVEALDAALAADLMAGGLAYVAAVAAVLIASRFLARLI